MMRMGIGGLLRD
jgi:ADP-ribose pyrophosphatase YjhB (NUDIX family)